MAIMPAWSHEDVDDGAHQHQRAHEQPLAHARQVALDHGGQAGHHEEHAGRAGKAVMISSVPFLKPSTMPIRREHQAHEEGEAQQHGTPAAEFLVFSIANMKPKAPTMNTIRPSPPRSAR
jgi:hypothetical protein